MHHLMNFNLQKLEQNKQVVFFSSFFALIGVKNYLIYSKRLRGIDFFFEQ